jgi:hypothetical protein
MTMRQAVESGDLEAGPGGLSPARLGRLHDVAAS